MRLDLRSTYFLRIWTYSSASEWPSPSPPSPHAALFSGGFLKTSISMNHRLFSAYYIMQLDKVTQGKLFWPRLRQHQKIHMMMSPRLCQPRETTVCGLLK